ncbi:MAG: ribose-phosphate pyrophosphokinase-like domain-containing protein, partial [Novibacillus thermophilus]
MKLFAGSSNPKLTRQVARVLGIKPGNVQLSRFKNGEI